MVVFPRFRPTFRFTVCRATRFLVHLRYIGDSINSSPCSLGTDGNSISRRCNGVESPVEVEAAIDRFKRRWWYSISLQHSHPTILRKESLVALRGYHRFHPTIRYTSCRAIRIIFHPATAGFYLSSPCCLGTNFSSYSRRWSATESPVKLRRDLQQKLRIHTIITPHSPPQSSPHPP